MTFKFFSLFIKPTFSRFLDDLDHSDTHIIHISISIYTMLWILQIILLLRVKPLIKNLQLASEFLYMMVYSLLVMIM